MPDKRINRRSEVLSAKISGCASDRAQSGGRADFSCYTQSGRIRMLTYLQDAKHDDPWWSFLWKILAGASLIGLLVFWFTHGSLIDRIGREYPIVACLAVWTVGMLSYHQDATQRWWGFAFMSQSIAITSLINIVVLAFTHGSWPIFFIAPPLIWLHVQFTKRWWARPGVWW
jgi:hypothetical protein